MKEECPPLLSIIIPTKNRQDTCIYAIESALALKNTDIEVLVQDCSDTEDLKQALEKQFVCESRLKYEYTDSNPSMTENWNSALIRAKGDYLCFIGDDDAILPTIYETALWAKNNQKEIIMHNHLYAYIWTNVPTSFYSGNLIVRHSKTREEIERFDEKYIKKQIHDLAEMPNMKFGHMPNIYHCIVSKSIIKKLEGKTGKLLDGTAIDVYSSVAFGLLLKEYHSFNLPFTMHGVSAKSNSSKVKTKNYQNHLEAFKVKKLDNRLPEIPSLTYILAESVLKAFSNFKNSHYPKLLKLPLMYAQLFAQEKNLDSLKIILAYMKRFEFGVVDYFSFLKHSTKLIFRNSISIQKDKLKKILIKFSVFKNYFDNKTKKEFVYYPADNIVDAIELLKEKRLF